MGCLPAFLPDRGVVAVSGPDARALLNNLVTARIDDLAPGKATLSALLSPQGKILFDFLILCDGAESFLLDTPLATAPDLVKRLTFYKLRAKMDILDRSSELGVAAVGEEDRGLHGTAFLDPRLPELGWRLIGPRAELAALPDNDEALAEWEARRIALGIPEGARDIAYGDTFPHEACMDQFGGIDFGKGCYVGQEVVSRMEHRGTARTRMVPVRLDSAASAGMTVETGGRTIGRLGSVAGARALAMLRLDRIADAMDADEPVMAGSARLTLDRKPAWADFPYPGEPGFGARPA